MQGEGCGFKVNPAMLQVDALDLTLLVRLGLTCVTVGGTSLVEWGHGVALHVCWNEKCATCWPKKQRKGEFDVIWPSPCFVPIISD